MQQGVFNRAISALTYGVGCFIYHQPTGQIYDCILSIHEQYINILHIIVCKKVSYLLKLHHIENITDNQYTIQTQLKQRNISHYIVLYTQAMENFTFAFHTLSEQQHVKIGLKLFIRQAKMYFQRLTEFNPFKAESMLTFLEADKDGGGLLDIEQLCNILNKMRIYRPKEEILKDIQEIDKCLYQRQKLRRPQGMNSNELNQLGFQYLLRYYTIKDDLSKYFTASCPNFKLKPKSNKHLIVDIVRNNEKPIMSALQLQEFYQKMLYEDVSQEQTLELIRAFPVYDNEGKELQQQHDMISFNNFGSLLASKRNSAFNESAKALTHNMTNPLSDYFIFTDATATNKHDAGNNINVYEMSLKRGCRCLRVDVSADKDGKPVVLLGNTSASAEDVLKIIAGKAFEENKFPLILQVILGKLGKQGLDQLARNIVAVFDEHLYALPNNFDQIECLPSPQQLSGKILIMSNVKTLRMQGKEFPQQSFSFVRLVSLLGTRVDFERKGQCCWNYCGLEDDRIRRFQQVEDQNISNYTRKVLLKSGPVLEKGNEVNNSCSAALRMGVQFIGISYASPDIQNYIIQSLFLENGGHKGGYLLKPTWMHLRNPKTLYAKNFDVPMFNLQLVVVSGQNCVLNPIPSPSRYYIQVLFRGNRKEQEFNPPQRSPAVDVSYNSKFDLQCQFKICCLDLAMVVLLVREEGSNRILAGRGMQARHIVPGLRPVFLLGDHFKEIHSSYLFIHSQRKQITRKYQQGK